MLKFQAVADKTAKNFRGLLFWPHPVVCHIIKSHHITLYGIYSAQRSLDPHYKGALLVHSSIQPALRAR